MSQVEREAPGPPAKAGSAPAALRRPARRRAWPANLALLLASTLLTFLALELAARALLEAPPRIRIEGGDTASPASCPPGTEENGRCRVDGDLIVTQGLPDFGLYVFTPTGLRLKRNATVLVEHHAVGNQNVEIRTNSLGHRGRELGAKREDELRILVLGDSITLGDNVPEGETYCAQLERRLNAAAPSGKSFQVINTGVGSIGLETELAILRETGLATDPDLVLLGLYLNDADQSLFIQATRLPAWLAWSHLLRFAASRIDRVRGQVWGSRNLAAQAQSRAFERGFFAATHVMADAADPSTETGLNRMIYEQFQDWGYAWSGGFWTTVLPIVDTMHRILSERDVELVVLLFPVAYQVHAPFVQTEPQRRFEKEMRRRGIASLDLYEPLRKQYRRDGIDLFADHCHYRAEGDAFLGARIAEFLVGEVLGRDRRAPPGRPRAGEGPGPSPGS